MVNVVRTMAICCAIRKAQSTVEHAVLHMDGVVVLQHIVEVVVLLAALRAQQLSSPRYRLRQVLELRPLLLVLLLAVTAGADLNLATPYAIPMVHTVVVARLTDTAVTLMVTACPPMDAFLAVKVR